MIRLRCPECGKEFDSNAVECPNCGHPAVECEQIIPPGYQAVNNNSTNRIDNAADMTTHLNSLSRAESFYKHEKTIKTYANIVFYICLVVGGFIFVTSIILYILSAAYYDNPLPSLIMMIVGEIYGGIIVLTGYLTRAFLSVFADMSINLHEINRKMK